LAFATLGDGIVYCDDRRARSAITAELGPEPSTGSFGLLIRVMHHELLSVDLAFASYQQMCGRGGFLPEFSIEELKVAASLFSSLLK
jgi:hypothetical protein